MTGASKHIGCYPPRAETMHILSDSLYSRGIERIPWILEREALGEMQHASRVELQISMRSQLEQFAHIEYIQGDLRL